MNRQNTLFLDKTKSVNQDSNHNSSSRKLIITYVCLFSLEFLLQAHKLSWNYSTQQPRVTVGGIFLILNAYQVAYRYFAFFADKWSPALQIRTVLLSIQALLSAPNPDDPLANDVAEQWKVNEAQAIETGMRLKNDRCCPHILVAHPEGGRGYSPIVWVGVCCWDRKSPTLY